MPSLAPTRTLTLRLPQDMPFQNRFCTYTQSRQWIEKYCCDFIPPEQMKMLMGGSCARLLGCASWDSQTVVNSIGTGDGATTAAARL